MTERLPLNFCELPDDMLRVISEYCDLKTRCAVTCTSSALNSVFLGRVKLKWQSSERFLVQEAFRERICRRVVIPRVNLNLKLEIKEFTGDQIKFLNFVRSVYLYAQSGCMDPKWSEQRFRIQNLTELSLANSFGGKVSDVSALAGLKNLRYLDLSRTRVSNVSALASVTKLIKLYLNDTQVSDVSALAGVSSLTILGLSNTQVSDVSALAGLTNLTLLGLNNTQVSDVSALAGLNKLTIYRRV